MGIPAGKKGGNAFLGLAASTLLISGGISFLGGVLIFWLLSFLMHIPDPVEYIGVGAMTVAGLLQGGPLFIKYLKLHNSDWSPIGKKVFLRIKTSKDSGLEGLAAEGVYVNSIGTEVGEIRLTAPLDIGGAGVQTLFFTARKLKDYSENIAKGTIEVFLFTAAENRSQEDALAVAEIRAEKKK
ncbi:MAG: hypothetical protein A2X32_08815 [Elusimicrobia bacterium GWC2_64_44]|nr:MAG: hypothetical protein A2X32_08815 [Elusimicrobia bacterium GWC2_64_44]